MCRGLCARITGSWRLVEQSSWSRLGGANMRKFFNAIAKPVVVLLLRSPLHWLLDKHLMLLTITGRKSGKLFTFPVSYIASGDVLRVVSHAERVWWRNLGAGATVRVWLKGCERRGIGTVHRSAIRGRGQPEIVVEIQLV